MENRNDPHTTSAFHVQSCLPPVPFFPLTLPPTTSHLSSPIFISLSLSGIIPVGLPYTVRDELGGGWYEASTIVNGVDVE